MIKSKHKKPPNDLSRKQNGVLFTFQVKQQLKVGAVKALENTALGHGFKELREMY